MEYKYDKKACNIYAAYIYLIIIASLILTFVVTLSALALIDNFIGHKMQAIVVNASLDGAKVVITILVLIFGILPTISLYIIDRILLNTKIKITKEHKVIRKVSSKNKQVIENIKEASIVKFFNLYKVYAKNDDTKICLAYEYDVDEIIEKISKHLLFDILDEKSKLLIQNK